MLTLLCATSALSSGKEQVNPFSDSPVPATRDGHGSGSGGQNVRQNTAAKAMHARSTVGQVGHTVQCDPSRPENLLYYPLQVYDESPIV